VIFVIDDMLAIGVEATIISLGFGVTMLVCALLCLSNFEAIVILLAFSYSRASCDYNRSLNMEKMAIILWS
jgi:hypothetical protein